MTTETISTLALATVLSAILAYWLLSPATPKVIQGPPSLPVVGNLFHVPVSHPWMRFAEWKKLYGDFIPLKIFRRHLFVINSPAVAIDLFEKRSTIYSERPQRQMAILCGFDKALLFQRYGDRTRKTRKLMHAEISQTGVTKHKILQEREVLHYIRRIMQSPDSLLANTRRLAGSVILMIAYGHQVEKEDDPLIVIAEQVMTFVERVITPNNYLVDSLPILKHLPSWFPGAGFQREATKCRNLLYKMMSDPYSHLKNQLERGDALPESLLSRNLEGNLAGITDEESDLLMWTAGGLYAGGSHSTVAIIMSFFLCMIHHPDVQLKAHEELDKFLSGGSLPRLDDRPSLPYIDCILQEVLRWRPVAPLAAHSTIVDDTYNGIFIPAGSVLMANAWAFTHDEEIYTNPDKFDPDRFLSSDVPDPRTLVFGFGRRSCPGLHLVDNLLWMVIAVSLTTLDILPALSDDGNPMMPSVEYTSGAVSQPLPFRCRLRARRANSDDLISDAIDILN